MLSTKFCYLYLTCEDHKEASVIAEALLEKRLIVCAKQVPIDVAYWWQGKITKGTEILLIMESKLDLFDEVEKEAAKLHSYETFVLEAMPIAKVSKQATTWMNKELKNVKA